jgi:hypothetical protein
VISAAEAQFMAARLGALAEGARSTEIALKAVGDEFDAFVESSGAPVDKRPVRAFSLIEGGLIEGGLN